MYFSKPKVQRANLSFFNKKSYVIDCSLLRHSILLILSFSRQEVALTLLAAKQIHFPEGAMTLQQEIIRGAGREP